MATGSIERKTYRQWRSENWDRAHREGDISALSGTGIGGHMVALGCGDLLRPDSAVLCIGVGTGIWVREVAARVAEVWALDVSPLAEGSIAGVGRFTTELCELPAEYFDLALSLYVAPHMSTFDLQDQMMAVLRSLKTNGIFALHYKEPLNDGDAIDNREGADDEWRVAEAAGVLRRRRYLAELVERAGGRVARIVMEVESLEHQIREVGCHIVKAD